MPNDVNLFIGIGCLVVGILMIYIGCRPDMW